MPRYWKIAPGENASEWREWQEKGVTTIGWRELGDLTESQASEFNRRKESLLRQHPDWTANRLNQVWKFRSEIRPGDRILANNGTTEVVGVGTVVGDYFFEANSEHPHRIPVRWDDTTPRAIDQGGWRRTLIELREQEFQSLIQSTPAPLSTPFSPISFDLLQQAHQTPTFDFLRENQEDFDRYVIEPFKRVFLKVAELVPKEIKDVLETETNLFSRMKKNDYGRGGIYDFFWAAFYMKGESRRTSVQLFASIQPDYFDFGFSLGILAQSYRARFFSKCNEDRVKTSQLLSSLPSDIAFKLRQPDDAGQFPAWPNVQDESAWDGSYKDPNDTEIRVAVSLPREQVMQMSEDVIVRRIVDTFIAVFPLLRIALDPPTVEATGNSMPNPVYTLEQCATDLLKDTSNVQSWLDTLERCKQAILYGPPGTGKTFIAEHLTRHLLSGTEGLSELIQFHPSYAYEDFVQGLRPNLQSNGQVLFSLVPGRFMEFCRRAEKLNSTCVLILDEFNRANISRVFGELLYLLEYRERAITLASGGSFRIPSNVIIIGTMNTADRSIALVDHALRRRFAFLEISPDYEALVRFHRSTGLNVEPLVDCLKRINEQINDENFSIGTSFFLRTDLDRTTESIWKTQIEPYLSELFYGQADLMGQFEWPNVGEQIAPRRLRAA